MITYKELNLQNHEIIEISNVFLYLIEDRRMCDTQITCDLFFNYVERVKIHLEIQDNCMFSTILKDGDPQSKLIAENFMSGSREIKRIFKKYLKKWARRGEHRIVISNYPDFYRETNDMFELVLNRIQDETERLYPLVRSISGDLKKVA